MSMQVTAFRIAAPKDYDWIINVVDIWWGATVSPALPRYLLDHFYNTSFVAERAGESVGFLVGFFSAADADNTYIHFVGVRAEDRKNGLAAAMYQEFFDLARSSGRKRVSAITGVANTGSIRFHERMGFSVGDPIENYNAKGMTRIKFSRDL